MEIKGRHCVITGAGSGIGAALAKALSDKGAKLVVSDINAQACASVADQIGGKSFQCDVTKEEEIKNLIDYAKDQYGNVDLFCSNAGLAFGETENATSASNEQWQICWDIHVMSHVFASRALLPSMIERGDGYLINVASAAGLLNQIGDTAYSATKHAAVSLAESLAITHGSDGIKVSVVCPQYVATPLTGYHEEGASDEKIGVISAQDVATSIIKGIENETFLIHTHPDVHGYVQNRANDPERWISGMRKMRQNIIDAVGSTRLEDIHKIFGGKNK